jgi:hypothetical protein
MDLATVASDGANRAVTGADRAARAKFLNNVVPNKRFADLSRAALFVDMGGVFVSEELERADDRVGGTLTQAAQGCLDDL